MSRWAGQLLDRLFALGKALALPPETRAIHPPTAAESAALRAVIEHPDEDQARIAWAELAEARGEPRARLVREQMKTRAERRDRSWSVETSPATLSLLRRHPEWGEELRALGASEVEFGRGFAEKITIEADLFLARAGALRAAAPLLHLRLTGVLPCFDRLLASGLLRGLLSLDLSGEGIDDQRAARLAACPDLAGLRSLELARNRITNRGVEALYASPVLAGLIYCGLDANLCGPLTSVEWTLQEIPTQETLATEFLLSLERAHGPRSWAFSSAPPDRDVLTRGEG